MKNLSDLGYFGEDLAAKFLDQRGYTIIDKNFSRPWGEIDIICKKEGVVIFVEVKTNKKEMSGFEPESRVNHDKIIRMVRTAQTYLLTKKLPEDQEWRLDIVSVTIDRDRGVAKIRHFMNIDTQ